VSAGGGRGWFGGVGGGGAGVGFGGGGGGWGGAGGRVGGGGGVVCAGVAEVRGDWGGWGGVGLWGGVGGGGGGGAGVFLGGWCWGGGGGVGGLRGGGGEGGVVGAGGGGLWVFWVFVFRSPPWITLPYRPTPLSSLSFSLAEAFYDAVDPPLGKLAACLWAPTCSGPFFYLPDFPPSSFFVTVGIKRSRGGFPRAAVLPALYLWYDESQFP